MTHVTVPTDFTTPTGHIDLNNDNIGYVESYDFSTANLNAETRIAAISTIASVCYANPKALGSISLFDRLANESAGLPSSSFEFVPILLTYDEVMERGYFFANSIKYGEWIEDDHYEYLLTNLRALMADIGTDVDEYYNTPEECAIIAKNYRVYKSKIDVATTQQFTRHRVSWQGLSRRYVSGKKMPFEFYLDPSITAVIDQQAKVDASVTDYGKLITAGVKPEKARRVLDQSMYTTIWSAWTPKPLKSFYDLRLDSHAQSEIRELAEGMRDLH
jgi:thymidylate synthase (FAD)